MNQLHAHAKLMVDLIEQSGGMYTRPRVDYYEFRNRWLPLFNYSSNKGLAPLGEWIEQCCQRSAFMDVDVIKNGKKIPDPLHPGMFTIEGGTYMFTVPPILNREIIFETESGKTVDNILITAQQKGKVIAAAGTRHLEANLINGLKIDVPVDPGLFERMNKIFEHFGVKRTVAPGVDKKTESSNHTTEDPKADKIDNDLLDFSF